MYLKKTENVKKSVNIGIKRLPGSKLSSFFTLACLSRSMSGLQTVRINSCQSKRRIFHKIQDTQASNHKHPGFDVSTPESSNGTFPSLEARSSTALTALCGTSLGAWSVPRSKTVETRKKINDLGPFATFQNAFEDEGWWNKTFKHNK